MRIPYFPQTCRRPQLNQIRVNQPIRDLIVTTLRDLNLFEYVRGPDV